MRNPSGQVVTENDYSTTGNGKWNVTYMVTDNDDNVVYATRSITISSSSGGGGGGSDTTTYTLTFETNGGSSISTVSKASGSVVSLSGYTTTREGYTFTGWYADKALTTKVTSVTLTKSTTVYASWKLNEVEEGNIHEPYISGYSDGTFRPDGSITRAEAAQLLYNISGGRGAGSNNFSDVPSGSWYYNAVTKLTSNGVISGYSDGSFQPQNGITRAEFVTLVARYAKLTETTGNSFSDVPSEYWAANNIAAATQAGYISGYTDGTFRPDAAITRAEAVTVLNAMLGREIDEDVISGLTMPFPDVPTNHWAYYQILEAAVEHEK